MADVKRMQKIAVMITCETQLGRLASSFSKFPDFPGAWIRPLSLEGVSVLCWPNGVSDTGLSKSVPGSDVNAPGAKLSEPDSPSWKI